MPQPHPTTTIDVRHIAPVQRSDAVLSAFRATGLNAAIEIVDDHDPKPIYHRLQAEAPGGFSWICAESGPAVWRVNVRKLARDHGAGECCGMCGGPR